MASNYHLYGTHKRCQIRHGTKRRIKHTLVRHVIYQQVILKGHIKNRWKKSSRFIWKIGFLDFHIGIDHFWSRMFGLRFWKKGGQCKFFQWLFPNAWQSFSSCQILDVHDEFIYTSKKGFLKSRFQKHWEKFSLTLAYCHKNTIQVKKLNDSHSPPSHVKFFPDN